MFHRLSAGLILPLLLCAMSSSAYGQLAISGTVTSDEGEPLIGVTIRVKEDLNTGTVTDFDGKYELTVPSGSSTLLMSYTGYETQNVAVNNRTVIDVTLATDAETLEEVVVVGYGYVDKKDLTGSVSSVKGEDLTRVQAINFERGLAAQAAGVQITSTQGVDRERLLKLKSAVVPPSPKPVIRSMLLTVSRCWVVLLLPTLALVLSKKAHSQVSTPQTLNPSKC